MSTKAQDFRVEQQRTAHPPRPKGMKKLRKEAARGGAEGTLGAATAKSSLAKTAVGRLHSDRAARRGGSRLEDSAPGAKPSRKSTRKSEGHIKLATNLTRRTIRKTHAPKTRATKAASRGKR